MTPEQWQRIKAITADALELEPGARREFIESACDQDTDTLQEVLRLVRQAETSSDDILNSPVMDWRRPASEPLIFPPRFEVLREAGRGGMGVVFECFDRDRNLRVALKTLTRMSPVRLYAFKQEFRALTGITHPNLASLYELIQENSQYFLSMEFIDGVNFLEFVREPGGVCDMERLRPVLRQVAAGLNTIHAVGKLHRDLKPSNVMVTASGRVVILDFGLIAEIQPERFGVRAIVPIGGTAAYMAPEQRRGILSPAGDCHSLGVMLFEALTGRIPPADGLLELPASVPEDLGRICRGLLAPEPETRFSAGDILDLLGEPEGEARYSVAPSVRLVGRESEMRALENAFEKVAARQAEVVLLRGASGTGKTALAEHFLKTIPLAREVVVLTGRCYEQEAVPYKAVDSLIDQLSQLVTTLPRVDAEAILPRDASSLATVFPVLECAPEFAEACRRQSIVADPVELRRRAFLALREMLARIGERTCLALWLDDLQWMDQESALLVSEVMHCPDAPVLMLLCTYRTDAVAANPGLMSLLETLDREPVSKLSIELQPLNLHDSVALAQNMLGATQHGTVERARAIAQDSGGLPFFIRELAHLAHVGGTTDLSLESLIWRRVTDLEAGSLRLLSLIAVAGRPIEQGDLFRAAATAKRDPAVLNRLAALGLIRSAGPHQSDLVETYHDRIRETISARLTEGESMGLHRDLGEALEAGGRADPERLATHFEAAGEFSRAGAHYSQAADRAARAVAFNRAALLYEKSLTHSVLSREERGAMELKLAEVLADGGRSGEASRNYFLSAEHSASDRGLSLESIGAYHLCAAGMIDEGRERFFTLFKRAGRFVPRRRAGMIATMYWRVLRLRIPDQIEPATQVSTNDLAMIDLLWFAAAGIGTSDLVCGFSLLLESLTLALRAREPLRLIRALAFHVAFAALAGQTRSKQVEREWVACKELAEKIGQPPEARATLALTEAIRSYNSGLWSQALTAYVQSEKTLVEECRGLNWELSFARTGKLWTLTNAGEAEELWRQAGVILEDALSRGDRVTATNAGSLPLPYSLILLLDEPDAARTTVERWLGDWTQYGFGLQHACGFLAMEWAWLYEGRVAEAYELLERQWDSVRRSGILRLPTSAVLFWETRARVLAGMAALGGHRRSPLLRELAGTIRRLQRVDAVHAPGFVAHLQAISAGLRRDRSGAIAHMRRAVEIFDQCEMKIHALASRRRLGEWIGGAEGAIYIAEADRSMLAAKIANPPAVCRMHTVELSGF